MTVTWKFEDTQLTSKSSTRMRRTKNQIKESRRRRKTEGKKQKMTNFSITCDRSKHGRTERSPTSILHRRMKVKRKQCAIFALLPNFEAPISWRGQEDALLERMPANRIDRLWMTLNKTNSEDNAKWRAKKKAIVPESSECIGMWILLSKDG